MTRSASHKQRPARPLRVGFVPLCDCAPIVMAQELGLFGRHGLEVEVSREAGWVLENLLASGAVPAGTLIGADLRGKVFRRDLFLSARAQGSLERGA